MAQTDIRRGKDVGQLIRVALGQEAADLVVINARLVNVYTGELLDGQAVAVKGSWIAAVGNLDGALVDSHTRVIDAAGQVLIPGLIDGHAHLSWYCCIDQVLTCLMVGGTTTVITETMEIYPVAALAGVLDYIAACRDQPIKIFVTAPFMASISRSTHGVDPGVLQQLLGRTEVVGLGESYWQSALQHLESTVQSISLSRQAGKTIEGHTAGARGSKLMAYVAAGVSSCHEPITPAEILERLRLGLHVMVREGSIRQDLGALTAMPGQPGDQRRLILVTDGVSPADLLERGYLETVVQKAIDGGIDPVRAIQMATLNVAEHFALDDIIGGIAPGRCADMVIIPDIKKIQARCVISNGCVIAEHGRLLAPPRRHAFSAQSLCTVHLSRSLDEADFAVRIPNGHKKAVVRVIEMVTDLVTREHHQEIEAMDGCIAAEPGMDLIKVAAIDRRRNSDKIFTGLIKGFGLKSGAVASSAAWDTADIIAVGVDDSDLAMSVNRIHQMQGGVVVCAGGNILEELAMPIFGILSPLPMSAVDAQLKSISNHIKRLGCNLSDPLLALVVLTGAAIPFLRICEEGLVNLKEGAAKGLFVDPE